MGRGTGRGRLNAMRRTVFWVAADADLIDLDVPTDDETCPAG